MSTMSRDHRYWCTTIQVCMHTESTNAYSFWLFCGDVSELRCHICRSIDASRGTHSTADMQGAGRTFKVAEIPLEHAQVVPGLGAGGVEVDGELVQEDGP